MNRNQKIGVGCGAIGCLGLIVVAVAGGFIYYLRGNAGGRTYNFNASPNVNSNRNTNTNANQSGHESTNSSSTNSSDESASSMSDDDKHKLFQAAGMTQDQELLKRVLKKLGLIKPNGLMSDSYAEFIKDHISWSIHNSAFVTSINTPEKAKAYVDEHFHE